MIPFQNQYKKSFGQTEKETNNLNSFEYDPIIKIKNFYKRWTIIFC